MAALHTSQEALSHKYKSLTLACQTKIHKNLSRWTSNMSHASLDSQFHSWSKLTGSVSMMTCAVWPSLLKAMDSWKHTPSPRKRTVSRFPRLMAHNTFIFPLKYQWSLWGTHHNLNCLSSLSSITQWSLLEVQMPMHNSQERERETLSLTHTHKSREREREWERERVSVCVYMCVCVCVHACMCCNLYALNVFKICSFKDV